MDLSLISPTGSRIDRIIDLGFAFVDWLSGPRVNLATAACMIWIFTAGYILGKVRK